MEDLTQDRQEFHQLEADLYNNEPVHLPTHQVEQRPLFDNDIGVEYFDWCLDCDRAIDY